MTDLKKIKNKTLSQLYFQASHKMYILKAAESCGRNSMGVVSCSLPWPLTCTTPSYWEHPVLSPLPTLYFLVLLSVAQSFCFAPFLTFALLSPPPCAPPIPLERRRESSQTVPWGHRTQEWWIGLRVHGSRGGCGALQCSMTDGNMHYFPGGIGQRGPECSISLAHVKGACSTEKWALL